MSPPRLLPLLLLAAAGGALGGGGRAALGLLLPPAGALPVGTLAANLAGCLALGALLGASPGPRRRAFAGTGVLGGFTTWSALALEVDGLLGTAPLLAAGYLGVSLAGGLGLAAVGQRLVRPARRGRAGGRP